MPNIVLTGGGTAGHVTPNLALIPLLEERGYTIHYIGSKSGIERQLIEALPRVSYYPIACGKLRRYLDLKNLSDPFKVIQGAGQATRLIHRIKPVAVFSKGGFVSVPVILGAWFNRVPSVLHESDMTPGLANKLALPLCTRLCATFPEAAQAAGAKGVCTGAPIRPELLNGDRQRGLQVAGLAAGLPVLLIMGGSMGAQAINDAVDAALPQLLRHFQIIHIRGKGALNSDYAHRVGYAQFEYVNEELPDLFAACDLVLSRAGANAIWEFAALHRPMLLIPLPLSASRGDQIKNAESFRKLGFARVLPQEDMTASKLLEELLACHANRAAMIQAQVQGNTQSGLQALLEQILAVAKVR